MADETKNLPDVDLSPITDQLKQDQPTEPQQPQKPEDFDLGQFKNPKDLLKSYKEIQGAFTKISQATKDKDKELADLREQVNIMRLSAQASPMPKPLDKPIDQAIFERPAEVISNIVQAETLKGRIADVLEEEHLKNPNEFQERYAVVNMLSQNPQYVQLCRSGQGVRKLFEIADKFRDERVKTNARKALEGFFGGPLDDEAIARLKESVVKKPNQQQSTSHAYMPDTLTSSRTSLNSDNRSEPTTEIEQAAAKGDVDGTIAALMRRQLAE